MHEKSFAFNLYILFNALVYLQYFIFQYLILKHIFFLINLVIVSIVIIVFWNRTKCLSNIFSFCFILIHTSKFIQISIIHFLTYLKSMLHTVLFILKDKSENRSINFVLLRSRLTPILVVST